MSVWAGSAWWGTLRWEGPGYQPPDPQATPGQGRWASGHTHLGDPLVPWDVLEARLLPWAQPPPRPPYSAAPPPPSYDRAQHGEHPEASGPVDLGQSHSTWSAGEGRPGGPGATSPSHPTCTGTPRSLGRSAGRPRPPPPRTRRMGWGRAPYPSCGPAAPSCTFTPATSSAPTPQGVSGLQSAGSMWK